MHIQTGGEEGKLSRNEKKTNAIGGGTLSNDLVGDERKRAAISVQQEGDVEKRKGCRSKGANQERFFKKVGDGDGTGKKKCGG